MTAVSSQPDRLIAIYAELLSFIGQTSVTVSLATATTPETRAEICDNGTVIRFHHDGRSESVKLPAPVAQSSSLPLPQKPSQQVSWRLPASTKVSRPTAFSLENQSLPWNAVDIKPGSPISCRKCGHIIVKDGVIDVWKDLPSENWAEMMEFWHCHKPHDHDSHTDGEHLTKRGYGATNSISAQASVGFVDITSFVFVEEDCDGLLFSVSTLEHAVDVSEQALGQSEELKFLRVYCKACSVEVGLYSVLASSVSLFKWQVSCNTGAPTPLPTSPQCLAATLTATISRSGSSKSVILPHSASRSNREAEKDLRALHLWVLNPSITYASSVAGGGCNAMKILFRVLTIEEGNALAESLTSDVQDISLPMSVIADAQKALEGSNLCLPEKERIFKEWRVGLLGRWDSRT